MSTPRKQAEGIVEIYLIELNTPSIETRRAKQNLIDNIAKALGAAQPKPAAEVVEALEVPKGHIMTDDGTLLKWINRHEFESGRVDYIVTHPSALAAQSARGKP